MEHRTTNSRRRTAGAYGQTRHADHGWRVNRRLGGDFNFAVGAAFERLCLDSSADDDPVWCDRFRGRLLQNGEAAKPGSDRQTKVAGSVHGGTRRLYRLVYFDQM